MVTGGEPPLLGTVDLPPLHGGRDLVLWPGLLELGECLPRPFTLIGGQMVYLHGAVVGRTPPRVTNDIDVLFDVRAQVKVLTKAVGVLRTLGYEVDGMSPDLLAHRYVRDDGMVVDVLAPDNLGPRVNLTTTPPGRTVEVPGGTATLRNRVRVEARYGSRRATLYVPDLPRALMIKVRALLREVPRPNVRTESRHVEDIAFLVSLISDPDELPMRPQLALDVLDDPNHFAWQRLDEFAEDAHLVWQQLRCG